MLFIDQAHTIFLKGIPGQFDSDPSTLNLHTLVLDSTVIAEKDLEYSDVCFPSRMFALDRGKVFVSHEFELLEWTGSLAEEEVKCPTGDLNWWKISINQLSLKVNGLSLSRMVECLFTAK